MKTLGLGRLSLYPSIKCNESLCISSGDVKAIAASRPEAKNLKLEGLGNAAEFKEISSIGSFFLTVRRRKATSGTSNAGCAEVERTLDEENLGSKPDSVRHWASHPVSLCASVSPSVN